MLQYARSFCHAIMFKIMLPLPDFKPKGIRYSTIDPRRQKEDTEIYKIPKFGVNRANLD